MNILNMNEEMKPQSVDHSATIQYQSPELLDLMVEALMATEVPSEAKANELPSATEAQDSRPADNHYQKDHLIAKTIVCCAVMIFGFIGIYTSNPYVSLFPGTMIWFFGVNSSGYLIESLLHHEHLHNLF